jgi:hypothetical protein
MTLAAGLGFAGGYGADGWIAAKQQIAVGSSPAGRAKTASELVKYISLRPADRRPTLRQPATSAGMRMPGEMML